jgi:hypothetical protein
MSGSWLFVDFDSVAFLIDQLNGSNILQAGQSLEHLDRIVSLGHAGEVDITIAVVGLQVLFASITPHSDGSSFGEMDHLDGFDEWE